MMVPFYFLASNLNAERLQCNFTYCFWGGVMKSILNVQYSILSASIREPRNSVQIFMIFVYLNTNVVVIYNNFSKFSSSSTSIRSVSTLYFHDTQNVHNSHNNFTASSVNLFGKHNYVLIINYEHNKTCCSVNQ